MKEPAHGVPGHPTRSILRSLFCVLVCVALSGSQDALATPPTAPPGATGLLAQVIFGPTVIGPARAGLKRVSARLNTALKSGNTDALASAVTDAKTVLDQVDYLSASELAPLINSTRALYARGYLQLAGQLVSKCEKGDREAGQAARTGLAGTTSGNVTHQAVMKAYQTRLAKCLPVLKYEGKYYFKSKLANSSQNYVATITWTLWQNLPGGTLTYRPSGKIDAGGTSDKCSGSLHTTVSTDLGLLVVAPVTGTYTFAFGTTDLLKMTCPDGTHEESLFGGDTCETTPYVDVAVLASHCVDGTVEGRWLFKAVKE